MKRRSTRQKIFIPLFLLVFIGGCASARPPMIQAPPPTLALEALPPPETPQQVPENLKAVVTPPPQAVTPSEECNTFHPADGWPRVKAIVKVIKQSDQFDTGVTNMAAICSRKRGEIAFRWEDKRGSHNSYLVIRFIKLDQTTKHGEEWHRVAISHRNPRGPDYFMFKNMDDAQEAARAFEFFRTNSAAVSPINPPKAKKNPSADTVQKDVEKGKEGSAPPNTAQQNTQTQVNWEQTVRLTIQESLNATIPPIEGAVRQMSGRIQTLDRRVSTIETKINENPLTNGRCKPKELDVGSFIKTPVTGLDCSHP